MRLRNSRNLNALPLEESNDYLSTKRNSILCELAHFWLGKVLSSVKYAAA